VPAFGGGGPLIRERMPGSQSRAHSLCRVTLLVPESCVAGLRDLARVLRAQQQERTSGPLGWRNLSPSAELKVDAAAGARCVVRDTRAAGAERYCWTVTRIGEPYPVAAGRTGDASGARAQAEAALTAHLANQHESSRKRNGTDG